MAVLTNIEPPLTTDRATVSLGTHLIYTYNYCFYVSIMLASKKVFVNKPHMLDLYLKLDRTLCTNIFLSFMFKY